MKPTQVITYKRFKPTAFKKSKTLYNGNIHNRYAYSLMKVQELTNRYAYYKSYVTAATQRYGKIRDMHFSSVATTPFPWSVPEELVPINTVLTDTAEQGNERYNVLEAIDDYRYFIIQGGDEDV